MKSAATPATAYLAQHGVEYTEHEFEYKEHGGTSHSPIGTRKRMPIYLERSVLALPRIYINGGRRGYLLGMAPAELTRLLSPVLVDVALQE